MLDTQLTTTHHTIELLHTDSADVFEPSKIEFIVEHPLLERLNPESNLRACSVHQAIRSRFPEPEPGDAGTWFARIAPPNHPLAGTWQFIRRPQQ